MTSILINQIKTINDYFNLRVNEVHKYASLIVVIDPNRFLENILNSNYSDSNGKIWKIYHYHNNDFYFRKSYFSDVSEYNKLIWITPSDLSKNGKINLSYIVDIIDQADQVIDLSLSSVLKKLIPEEIWPKADEFGICSNIIAGDFQNFHKYYRELRSRIPQKSSINTDNINIICLVSLCNAIDIQDLFLSNITYYNIINNYFKIIFSNHLNDEQLALLRRIFKNSYIKLEKINPWIDTDISDIANFIYIASKFKKYSVPNFINQVKGLGISNIDLMDITDEDIQNLLNFIDSQEYKYNIFNLAEQNIPLRNVQKIINCIQFDTDNEISSHILQESSPYLIYGFIIKLLNKINKDQERNFDLKLSSDILDHIHVIDSNSQNIYVKTVDLINLYYELATIDKILKNGIEYKKDLNTLLDYYYTSEIYTLEYLRASAHIHIKSITDKNLKTKLVDYLDDQYNKTQLLISVVDNNLSNIIETNVQNYLQNQNISTNIIRDYILPKMPVSANKIWIIIIDGMRLDTWEKVVKPLIREKFEIINQKLYACALPSLTDIARVSLLAGRLPSDWKDYNGNWTSDHNILTSINLGLKQKEGREKLKVITSMEADFAQYNLDKTSSLYNVLIYNLSDDWIHSHRGDIYDLNNVIKNKLISDTLIDLETRISENDVILITSDHGFIELDRNDGIFIDDPISANITYRYLTNIDDERGVKLQYGNNYFYTLAKGKLWFQRYNGRFTRYSHGGISLAEVVVPAVELKKIMKQMINFELEPPYNITVDEDKQTTLEFTVLNSGNQNSNFKLIIEMNSNNTEFTKSLGPNEKTVCEYTFTPRMNLKSIKTKLLYVDEKRKVIEKPITLPINVKLRTDKVEFNYNALDGL